MAYFIKGIGNLSPQNTHNSRVFPEELRSEITSMIKIIHPDYKDYIDISSRRRMGNVVKMGITSALISLQDAGIENPGAIITCTGLGAVEDTDKFLTSVLDNNEQFLNPATFIQTTYNTISSLIAIRLQCHQYNSTYVHRSFSFETGLLDALMLLDEKEAETVLIGGVDDIIQNHFMLFNKHHYWKKEPMDSIQLLESKTSGTIAGEGATFFTVSSHEHPDNYCKIKGVSTYYSENIQEVVSKCHQFLNEKEVSIKDIDLVMLGINGDVRFDNQYLSFANALGENIPKGAFKHLSGDYYTASSFGMALSALAIYQNAIPDYLMYQSAKPDAIRNILLYNQFHAKEHSFILLGK